MILTNCENVFKFASRGSACKEEAETNRGILAKRKNDFSLALTQAHAVEEDRSNLFNNENADELGDLKALEAAIREVFIF